MRIAAYYVLSALWPYRRVTTAWFYGFAVSRIAPLCGAYRRFYLTTHQNAAHKNGRNLRKQPHRQLQ